ncbi:adenosylcobinamide-phosphate synthase CbiB [Qipengyuania sp. NPDC077563]|uniref:adenosylcobinamide-phosphate synthase CbiB n=1 Tax=Qipengyuania sp. NPDC077563 TaxID=3364497 RepID=UPI00384A83D5
MNALWLMLGGLVLETIFGWPDALDKRIGHPVRWFGWLVGRTERFSNRESFGRTVRIFLGGITTVVLVVIVSCAGIALQAVLPQGWAGYLLQSVIAASLIATRSLYDHVAAVASAFSENGLPAAREALSMIVGRETRSLDEHGIARAAIESLAENTSDGIIAPVFWGALFGLPGLFAYKAINTLDSMIGHRSPRFEAYGKVAARLDDLANLVPARLTGLLFCLVSCSHRSIEVMLRDASRHRSPNAGWPEAAMAGALGTRLSGPRHYGDSTANEPWLNAEGRDPSMADLAQALALYRYAIAVTGFSLLALGWVTSR